MSANVTVEGGLQPPKWIEATTSRQDLHTADTESEIVIAVTMSNRTAGAVTILLERWDGTAYRRLYFKSVPASDTITYEAPTRLLLGHKIAVQAGSNTAIDVTLSYVTQRRQSGQ